MKLVITILCMAALTGIAASAGSAAVPMEKRVAALEHQVKVLNKEVKVLKAQVKLLRGTLDSTQQDIQEAVGTEKLRDLCLAVGVEDLLQSTWTNVDQRLTTGRRRPPATGMGSGLRHVRRHPARDQHPAHRRLLRRAHRRVYRLDRSPAESTSDQGAARNERVEVRHRAAAQTQQRARRLITGGSRSRNRPMSALLTSR